MVDSTVVMMVDMMVDLTVVWKAGRMVALRVGEKVVPMVV